MVFVAASGGGAYCIDQYEVTYAQYEVFWSANPDFSLSECSWNTGTGKYTPAAHWPAPTQNYGKTYPVRSIDWCDAWAYCKYSGKRLCGKQGGGSVPYASFADASQSQWTNACNGGGVSVYSYGSSYDKSLCVGSDFLYQEGTGPIFTAAGAPYPGVRSYSTFPAQKCQGAAPNLFDMTGNVGEWEDSCDATAGASDNCHIRGGGYKEQGAAVACNVSRTSARNATPEDVGIRCCYP
jgi:formylglycine-generating enzyme required for sulfatase activity